MILLDTNVISELMRPEPDPVVAQWLLTFDDEPLGTTVITVSEIIYGLERLENGRRKQGLQERFEAFIAPGSGLSILALDPESARLAGMFRARRESGGQHAHPSDMFIAGIAGANSMELATRNTRDFSGLGLHLVNPWEG